jgi:hypothetical protein
MGGEVTVELFLVALRIEELSQSAIFIAHGRCFAQQHRRKEKG